MAHDIFWIWVAVLISGTTIVSGVLMGVYRAYRKATGFTYPQALGTFTPGQDIMLTTGWFPLLLLRGTASSVIFGYVWSARNWGELRASTFTVFAVLVFLPLAVVQHALVRQAVRFRIVSRLGPFAGSLIGIFSGGFLTAMLGFGILRFLKPATPLDEADSMLLLLSGVPGALIVGFITGNLGDRTFDGTRIQELTNGIVAEIAIWTVLGVTVTGGVLFFLYDGDVGYIGVFIGLFGGITYGTTIVMELAIARVLSRSVFFLLFPLVLVRRFATIICENCLRYTEPLQSRYDVGVRFCEHCQKPVEHTRHTGKVVMTFGTVSMPEGERIFVLENPDVESTTERMDVSEIRLDAATADARQVERLLTYLMNYPPKDGITSIRVYISGDLNALGGNLPNALRNNFSKIWEEE